MAQQGRQPLGKGHVHKLELISSESPPVTASATTQKLASLLSTEGDERKGNELDEFLTTLGDAYIEEGRVKWDPPSDLAPDFVAYFSSSVEALNKLIEAGTLRIDKDGNIVPGQ